MNCFRAVRLNADFTVRREELAGRSHLVVPVVMLTEGVHIPASGESLYYPSETLSQNPEMWNGIPVTVSHPSDDNGNLRGLESPDLYFPFVVGTVWGARFEDGSQKAEIWFEEEKLRNFPEAFDAIENGTPTDVSTGIYTQENRKQGTWNEESYEFVVEAFFPDHLAVLPGEEGACSWDDGCGIRANLKFNILGEARRPEFDGTEMDDWFDVPESFEAYRNAYYEFTETEVPEIVPDFVNEAPQEMLEWIASKTLLGDPNAEEEFGVIFFPVVNPETNRLNMNALKVVLSFKDEWFAPPKESLDSAKQMAMNLLSSEFDMSFEELEKGDQTVDKKKENFLKKLMGGISEVFKSEGYDLSASLETTDECNCQQQSNENKKQEENEMNREKFIESLISNEKTNFSEDDKKWLESLEDDQLQKLEPVAEDEQGKEEESSEPPESKVEKDEEEEDLETTVDSYIAQAPKEVQDYLEQGIKEHKAKREKLIKSLVTNKKNKFSEEEIREFETETLQNLVSLAGEEADYSLSAKPKVVSLENRDIPEKPRLFENKKKAANE